MFDLSEGTYPDLLKIAEVILFFKKGERNKRTNYRPSLKKAFDLVNHHILFQKLENVFGIKKNRKRY